jgi:hypothetical protein
VNTHKVMDISKKLKVNSRKTGKGHIDEMG